jgi:hypothetical protein
VACGDSIHPVRSRRPAKRGRNVGHLYYAPCCPLEKNIACSRGPEAREEYRRLKKYFRPDLG